MKSSTSPSPNFQFLFGFIKVKEFNLSNWRDSRTFNSFLDSSI
ncbi:hypothetical protein YN1HA_18060 [Sulfurisphaera ohwakuensis]